ncbi:hypothetical protein BN873_640003 [Candidatus Competibacter denitrificans Run_A_D11]|uniref:Uncharacterized protein n=1 Tax=Candidatus Competibacter denitrificans Run_A_D11 TaxID=1400863 RepID=W6MBY4_9GAMM|nr:hypothetical protein BN873_640003 [Candidatus Competibacter denitrificans Run_A_D11]
MEKPIFGTALGERANTDELLQKLRDLFDLIINA